MLFTIPDTTNELKYFGGKLDHSRLSNRISTLFSTINIAFLFHLINKVVFVS